MLPHLGDRRLRALRRIDVEEWLGRLRAAGYSNSTIHAARTVFGMVLTSTMDARVIAGNPVAGLRLPKGTSRSRHALTVEQVEELAAVVDPGGVPWCSSSPTAGSVQEKPWPSAACTSTTWAD